MYFESQVDVPFMTQTCRASWQSRLSMSHEENLGGVHILYTLVFLCYRMHHNVFYPIEALLHDVMTRISSLLDSGLHVRITFLIKEWFVYS